MMTRLQFLTLCFLCFSILPSYSFQHVSLKVRRHQWIQQNQRLSHIRKRHDSSISVKSFPFYSSVTSSDPYLSDFGWHNTSLPEASRITADNSALSPSLQAAKEYSDRIKEWANLYTNVKGLRDRFGRNRNRFFGDLDSAKARRLYQTLLPTALLPLVKAGVKPEDLAPLAYQARVAAKLYARERSKVPARIAANLFDGFRQLKRYGKFNTRGMSYDQVWEKYRRVILEDCVDEEGSEDDDLLEEDVTAQICLKILEKSVTTNQYIDRLFSLQRDTELGEDLSRICEILEADVHRLVDPVVRAEEPSNKQIRRYRTLRSVAMVKKRLLGKSIGKRR